MGPLNGSTKKPGSGGKLIAPGASRNRGSVPAKSPKIKDLNRIDGEPMNADGVRVDNIPRIKNIWLPRKDLKFYGRSTVRTRAVRWQDHLHVNVH